MQDANSSSEAAYHILKEIYNEVLIEQNSNENIEKELACIEKVYNIFSFGRKDKVFIANITLVLLFKDISKMLNNFAGNTLYEIFNIPWFYQDKYIDKKKFAENVTAEEEKEWSNKVSASLLELIAMDHKQSVRLAESIVKFNIYLQLLEPKIELYFIPLVNATAHSSLVSFKNLHLGYVNK